MNEIINHLLIGFFFLLKSEILLHTDFVSSFDFNHILRDINGFDCSDKL